MDAPRGTSDGPGRDLDEALLHALFSQAPSGLHVLDRGLRLVRFNTAARNIRTFPLDHALGRPVDEWAGDFYSEDLEDTLREVLDTGRPALDVEVRGRPGPGAPETVISTSWFRLQNGSGHVLGLAASIVDVTAQHRARAGMDLLRRASGRIGTTLDVFRTAQELADVTVPDLADEVVVDVLDSLLRGEAPPPGPIVERLPLRCAGHRSVPEAAVRPGPMIGAVTDFPFATPHAQSLADLRARLVPRWEPDAGPEGQAEGMDWVTHAAETDPHSLMVVPLSARGVVLGLAGFHRRDVRAPFDEDDLVLAGELADRTAVCLDNARLYTREKSAARILQLSLRPAVTPEHVAVETASRYLPTGSGGDWFDVIPLSGARVALVAGGTRNQGIQAAAVMAELRAAIGALAALDLPPEEVLRRLHDLVTRLDSERPRRPGDDGGDGGDLTEETTCLYAVYDPVSRQCCLASAGHPPPAVTRPGRETRFADVSPGPPLGRGVPRYRATETELPADSLLVLCNTALLEARSTDPGEQLAHIGGALLPAGRPLQDVCDTVLYALAPRRPETDAVLLLARTRDLPADRVASWTLPHDPAAAAEARAHTRRTLAAWGLDDLAFTAELVVSELVTNAVRYAGDPFRFRMIRDRTVTCEVTDTVNTAPQLRRAETDDEGGRGLAIIAQLAARWGVRPERRGKTIWAELALPDAG